MKNRRLLMTALLMVVFASGLYAQRDSLCMTLIDEWFDPDSIVFTGENMLLVSDYIYVPNNRNLLVFSLSETGNLILDTTLIHRPESRSGSSITVTDTLAFFKTQRDIVVLNISNPARPESLCTYRNIMGYDGITYLYVKDTIMYITPCTTGALELYNVSNLNEIEKITRRSADRPVLEYVLYPYDYAMRGSPYDDDWFFYFCHFADVDSFVRYDFIQRATRPFDAFTWPTRHFVVRDSFLFKPYVDGIVDAFVIDESFESIRRISYTSYSTEWQTEYHNILLHDSLLIVPWEIPGKIEVYNTSNPYSIHRLGYYQTPDYPDYRIFFNLVMIDSFLVANFGYGVSVFKFSCEESVSENALAIAPNQLQLDVYPNPFNSTCKIGFTLQGYEKPVLTIFNLQGRKVLDKSLELSQSSYIWDASGEASGVYIVVLRQGDNTATKRVMLLK